MILGFTRTVFSENEDRPEQFIFESTCNMLESILFLIQGWITWSHNIMGEAVCVEFSHNNFLMKHWVSVAVSLQNVGLSGFAVQFGCFFGAAFEQRCQMSPVSSPRMSFTAHTLLHSSFPTSFWFYFTWCIFLQNAYTLHSVNSLLSHWTTTVISSRWSFSWLDFNL